MQYKVSCYFGRGSDVACAEFKELADAHLFVENKLVLDAGLKVSVTYRIYDFDDLVKEYDPAKESTPAGQSQASTGGAQGQGSSAAFRPTPFNMAPRPTGTPQKWIVNPDEDNDEKKK